ncbi:hypothetical protein ACO0SA_002234 [Hanseniaspora valbyensis]
MKFCSSQGNNNKKNVVVLSLVTLLSIAILIFSCINIAGTSGNHLTGVYIGEADIRHINVSKILPSVSPVITILSKALTAKNVNTTQIFLAMEALGSSAALKPILELIIESNDSEKTIDALTTLAPLVASSNNTASLTDVVALIDNSNNSTLLFDTLSTLSSSSSDSSEESQLEAITVVMELISNSNNVNATLTDLVTLAAAETYLPSSELEAVLSLISLGGSNVTATLTELSTLSTASLSLNTTSEAALLVALQASYNMTTVLEGLIAQTNTTAEISAYSSLAALLSSSSNSTATLIDVATILLASASQNTTQLQYAKASISAVASLLAYSENATETLTLLPTLVNATSSDPSEASELLTSFVSVLQTSKNSTLTLTLLSDLLENSGSTDAVTALIELISASSNATDTLANLVTVATLAQTNSSAITPLLSIMEYSSSVTNVTEAYIYEYVLPSLLDNMNFATNYKMGVFSLCKYNTKGNLYYCTKSHAVQSFVMKDILYEELENSSFSPYVKALGLTKDDVVITGELPKKQHLYVPAVRAILAFAIITIVASVIVPVLFITGLLEKLLRLLFTPLLIVNSLLVAIIASAVGGLVKHGLKHDKYNVTWKIGSALYALSWIAFVLSLVAAVFIFTTTKKAAPVSEQEDEEEEQQQVPEQETETVGAPIKEEETQQEQKQESTSTEDEEDEETKQKNSSDVPASQV